MHAFLPFDQMWRRIDLARSDSDTALFLHLLYLGEFTTKLVASALVSVIADDMDRHRYGLLYKLIRADSLGEWADAIDAALAGCGNSIPASAEI